MLPDLEKFVSVFVGLTPIISHVSAVKNAIENTKLLLDKYKIDENVKGSIRSGHKFSKISLGVSIARDVLALIAIATVVTLACLSVLNLSIAILIGIGAVAGTLCIISLAISAYALGTQMAVLSKINALTPQNNEKNEVYLNAEKNLDNPYEFFTVSRSLIDNLKNNKMRTSIKIDEAKQSVIIYALHDTERGRIGFQPTSFLHSRGQDALFVVVEYDEKNNLAKIAKKPMNGINSSLSDKQVDEYSKEVFNALKKF
jgi:hypothetical protein